MMESIEQHLFTDPQQLPHLHCPNCGSCVYPPSYHCIRCGRDEA